jgi:hypothetical protein
MSRFRGSEGLRIGLEVQGLKGLGFRAKEISLSAVKGLGFRI